MIQTTIAAVFLLGILAVAERRVPVERGLLGSYYSNIEWKGEPDFSVVDDTIDLGTVDARRLVFPRKMYCIYWRGWLQITVPGTYAFSTRSDDGSSLYVQGQQLIDNGGFHASRTKTGSIELPVGFHRIEIRYFQGEGNAAFQVAWQPPGEDFTDIPPEQLFPHQPFSQIVFIEQAILWAVFALKLLVSLLLLLTLSLHWSSFLHHGAALAARCNNEMLLVWQALKNSTRAKFWIGGGVLILFFLLLATHILHNQHGLDGKYYANPDWQAPPAFSMTDASIEPSAVYQAAGRPHEANSLEWTGWMYVSASGGYHFFINTEGVFELTIDEEVLFHKENNDRIQSGTRRFYLPAGLHQLTVRYRPGTGAEHLLELDVGTVKTALRPLAGEMLFQDKPEMTQVYAGIIVSWLYYQLILFWGCALAAGLCVLLANQCAIAAWGNANSAGRAVQACTRAVSPLFAQCQRTWIHLLLILLLSLLFIFNNLGRGSIITTDYDEGMHTRVAQYMADTGIWWSLYSEEGVPYYNKPPLKIWLNALTFRLFGDSEFCLRFWDAVFGALLLVILYFFGKALFSKKSVGLLAVFILLGGEDFLLNHSIRTGVMDSLMLFFFVSALCCFSRRTQHARFYYLTGICLGLGALTKSAQGLVPLAVIVVYLFLSRQYHEIKTRQFWSMLALAFLFPALWYVPQIFISPGFYETAIIQQIFHRVQGKIHETMIYGPFYFFGVIYQGFFPWSILAVPAMLSGLWRTIRQQRNETLLLLAWIIVVFVGFSLSKMKATWYMNPLYPALALLIASECHHLFDALRHRRRFPLLRPIMQGILGMLLFLALYANYQRVEERPEKLPIHIFTDYVQDALPPDYRVIAYNMDSRHFDYADRYYLDRISDHLIWLEDMEDVYDVSRREAPFCILMKRKDYDTQPFFQQHDYHYWLNPVYASALYPERLILLYDHRPDSSWFIKNRKKP